MLEKEDRAWLLARYPKLSVDSDAIAGVVDIDATFNEKINQFLDLSKNPSDGVGGSRLSGSFKIELRERTDKSLSKLPALRVEGVEPIADRHFGQIDKTACLCSPFEEDEFLIPQFHLKRFFEKLVVPFLYGQLFYSAEGRWPWDQYSHGAVGLLEAYFKVGDSRKAEDCLQKLAHDRKVWPRIKEALEQKSYVKGHIPCFCEKRDHIRRCHPTAMKGLQQLRLDVQNWKIRIP